MNKYNKKLTLLDLGEEEIIKYLSKFAHPHKRIVHGIGDDCAVCSIRGNTNNDQVFTSDATIQDTHFSIQDTPEKIGHKAIGRAYSDLASMGAYPEWVLINIVAPKEMNLCFLEKVYNGILERMDVYGGTLIGGDLSEGEQLSLNVFATGLLPHGTAVTRLGALKDDIIWTTGKLGNSSEGKHLNFIPRIKEGIWLRENQYVHSMTDLSDGLFIDLNHIVNNTMLDAILEMEILKEMAEIKNVLHDGEDYELLFTTSSDLEKKLMMEWYERFDQPLYKIGKIIEGKGEIKIRDKKKDYSIESLRNHHF